MTLWHDHTVTHRASPDWRDDKYGKPTEQRYRRLASLAAGLVLLGLLVPLRELWAAQAMLIPLLLILPGVILLRALRIPGSVIAANPAYVPCASLIVLIGSGLVVDLIGPSLGAVKPLRVLPLLIGLEITCVALLACSLRAGKEVEIPWGKLSRPLQLAWPFVLSLAGAGGALRLNAGYTNHVAMLAIFLVVSALCVFFLIAQRTEESTLVAVIYAAALSMLWSFSLRGDLVYGFDISNEYHTLQQTETAGIWHLSHPGNAYGSMLSLTVLPTELHALSGISALLIFKVVYPMFSAIFPVAVFCIARRFLANRWAFLAAVLVITQQPFFQEFPALARQEIATAFFAALISALFETTLRTRRHWAFVALLSVGIVVSHYSTDYMTILLLVLAVVIQFLLSWFRNLPRAEGAVVAALCVCLGGAVLWYGILTHSTSNLSQFISAASSNGLDLLPNRSGNLITSYLGGEKAKTMSVAQYQKYIAAYYAVHMPYVKLLPDAGQLKYALKAAIDPSPPSAWPLASTALNLLALLIQQSMNLLAGIGALMLLSKKASLGIRHFGVIALAGMVILVLVRVSGTVAQQYNPERAFLQMLIVLATAICWSLSSLGKWKFARTITLAVCAAGMVVLAVVQSTLGNGILGQATDANLANRFTDYQDFVASSQEIASAQWLASFSKQGQLIYADQYGELRLFTVFGNRLGVLGDVTPETIDRNSWVYASHANMIDGITRSSDTGGYFNTYAFPKLFLEQNFDTVYTNGISEVFHR